MDVRRLLIGREG